MKKSKSKLQSTIVVLMGLFMLFAALFGGRVFLPAFADTTTSSGVLSDLQRDETFDVNDYPDDFKDYSIHVIQIAESTDGKLIVYTYQPCQKLHYLVATDINMSLSKSVDGTKLYGLTLLSCTGVFGKYVVNGVTVSSDAKRYYNITSIYREVDRYLDPPAENSNTINKVSFEVGILYIAETIDGDVIYPQPQETVTITDKYVGNLLYNANLNIGWGLSSNATNAMYVAFDCDKDIDYLYEADVTYSTQSLQYTVKTNFLQFWNRYKQGEAYDIEKGAVKPQAPVTLTYTDKDSAGKYSWYQIQTVEEFQSNLQQQNVELTEDAKENLKGKKFVLNFLKADVQVQGDEGIWTAFVFSPAMLFVDDPVLRTTIVSEVSVLRLNFEHDGKIYNLGAVDSASTGSNKPDNRLPGFDENNKNFDWWQWSSDKTGIPVWGVKAIFALIVIVVFGIVIGILSIYFPGIRVAIKLVFQWIGKAICWPFQQIAKLAEKSQAKEKATKKTKAGSAKSPGKSKAKSKAKKKATSSAKKSSGKATI